MSAPVKRWYRWRIPGCDPVSHWSYVYSSSRGNVEAIGEREAAIYGYPEVEGRDVIVRAVKRPPMLWLIREHDVAMRAVNRAIAWRAFEAVELERANRGQHPIASRARVC